MPGCRCYSKAIREDKMKGYILKRAGLVTLALLFLLSSVDYCILAEDERPIQDDRGALEAVELLPSGEIKPKVLSREGEKFPLLGEKQEKAPEYAPGEVLVKFREGAEPQGVLKAINLAPKSVERVYSAAPAVAKFKGVI
jgi:hypothetical protein